MDSTKSIDLRSNADIIIFSEEGYQLFVDSIKALEQINAQKYKPPLEKIDEEKLEEAGENVIDLESTTREQYDSFSSMLLQSDSRLEQASFYRNTLRRTSKAAQIVRGRRLKYNKEYYANRRYLGKTKAIPTTEL